VRLKFSNNNISSKKSADLVHEIKVNPLFAHSFIFFIPVFVQFLSLFKPLLHLPLLLRLPLPPRRRRRKRRSLRKRTMTWDSAFSTRSRAVCSASIACHTGSLACTSKQGKEWKPELSGSDHPSHFRVNMALTPASRPKIVKKRTKKFIRHQSDRYSKLKRNWRKPKVRFFVAILLFLTLD
jgi:hypothetical protein